MTTTPHAASPTPEAAGTTPTDQWWKTATVYQIYPRSFQDSNGDGIGDIPGITARVPHLAKLGVDVVWLSPVYASPMEDNGYDISDYEAIAPEFGTLDDLDTLLETLHAHGIKLVMDLVVNHTSADHPWFVASRDVDDPKHDWYVWREPRPGRTPDPEARPGEFRGDEPNGWTSCFSGPAWEWDEEVGKYYLHFFARRQPDLNWENPDMRAEVYAMMRRWLDRGIDGFRMDVISIISKDQDMYRDITGSHESIGFGPRFHEFMQEMRREVFDAYPDRVILTVGETPGVTLADAQLTTDPARRELDMVFQFEHMALDSDGVSKWNHRPLHLPDMKANLARWAQGLAGRGWNSLFLSNHDQPRPVSRYGDAERFRHESATAWGAMLHAHPGTPYVYQGEELGMGNFPWTRLDQFDDVEVFGLWRDQVELGGVAPEDLWPNLARVNRDNARTPVQWDASENAGFTTGTPWLAVNPDHVEVNAAAQVGVDGSTFEFYRRMIALRKELPVLVHGSFELLAADDETLWWVRRELDGVVLDAVANMSSEPLNVGVNLPEGEVVLSNTATPNRALSRLDPWEVRWVVSR